MKRHETAPAKGTQSQHKPQPVETERFPVAQPIPQNPVVALQGIIGNQAVQRLLRKPDSAVPAVQRLQEINEDVIVHGQLAADGGVSGDFMMGLNGVVGSHANFTGPVAGSEFISNGGGAGAGGAPGVCWKSRIIRRRPRSELSFPARFSTLDLNAEPRRGITP